MKNWPRLFFPVIAGVGCCALLGLLLLFVNYGSGRAVPTFPRVTITTTVPEGSGAVNHPVVVFGEASDPDGIGSAELWVNGQTVASQANADQGRSPFKISQSWIPDGPGNYLFLLRGVDRKGFAGESAPVMIQVGERSTQPDPTLAAQYIVQDGDTLESIAARFGTTADEIRRRNPDLGDLTPGLAISIPPGPEAVAAGDATPSPASTGEAPPAPAGDAEEPPHVAAPAPPSSEEGIPADAASPPWWGRLPLPDSFACIINPALCAPATGGDAPAIPASDIHANLVDACQVSVSWTDNSTGEAGFRVYRLVMRPRFRSDLLELLDPAPGSGRRLTYADTSVPTGQFFYAIVTINARGEEVWSAPSEAITSTCPSSAEMSGRSIDVEALEMRVGGSSVDRLYCYFSLVAPPFERVPAGASDFITLEGGIWNIAAYASGENKRTLMVDETRPLDIVVECLGRQGDTLINLGRFTRSHPPEQWDGRRLTAGPDSGAFSVTYRIQTTPPEAYGGGAGDPSVPVPFNLRATDSWESCTRTASGRVLCTTADEPGLAWDYTVDPSAPQPPLYFNVYKQAAGGGTSSLLYRTLDGTHMSAPRGDCEHASYVVSAVVGYGSAADPAHPRRPRTEVQSSVSAPLEIHPATCGQLEITLKELWVYDVTEVDNQWEAYGALWFNDTPVIWNGHCDSGGCLTSGPSYTVVNQATLYFWADMFLSVGRGPMSRGHNVFRVPIRDGAPLQWHLVLWDHNDVGDDSTWCGGRRVLTLPARSMAEWLSLDQDVTYNDPPAPLYDGCAIYLHVRGIP